MEFLYQIKLFPHLFLIVATIWSLLYGLFAEKIFGGKEQRKKNDEEFGLPGHLHQFWLNFVGAAAGWFALYLFIRVIQEVGVVQLSFIHLILLLIAIVGISGWLPWTLSGINKVVQMLVKH